MAAETGLGERVVVLAPLGRDADLTVSVLQRAGRAAQSCASMEALIAEIQRGAGVALVTGECLAGPAIAELGRVLKHQPAWSDFPVLVFTPEGWGETTSGARVLASLQPLGNVSLLERPIRLETLLSSVEAALRARRRQYEVRDLLGQLHEGMHQRDQFLAMLGHELRNPLNALLTALQNLGWSDREARTPATSPATQQEAIAFRQGQILSRLVNDLLEVSRVTSGKVTLRQGVVDLIDLARSVVDAFAPEAVQQGVEVALRVEVTRPVRAPGDHTRLGQVLSNLLANAIKYTPAGGRVQVAVWAEGPRALVAVRDTGMGIQAEMLPRIFDLFRQGDHTLERAGGGLGIGLTLVRSLVELHGGTVQAVSPGPGRGSEFLVSLPATSAAVPTADVPDSPPPADVAHHVFVLEDHADNREGLVFYLRQLGHRVDEEEDGAAGARRIIEARPEVALIDIGLPGLDGYQVARRVREVLGSGILLIALTGYGQHEDRRRALEAGFDAHMAKPIDFVRLRALLAESGRKQTTLP